VAVKKEEGLVAQIQQPEAVAAAEGENEHTMQQGPHKRIKPCSVGEGAEQLGEEQLMAMSIKKLSWQKIPRHLSTYNSVWKSRILCKPSSRRMAFVHQTARTCHLYCSAPQR